MQHSLAASALIKYSPAPVVQQPAWKGNPKGPFEDAQQPEPYVPANPTRPLTYQEERLVLINRIKQNFRGKAKIKCFITADIKQEKKKNIHYEKQKIAIFQKRIKILNNYFQLILNLISNH